LDKKYLVEYEYRNSGESELKTGQTVVESFSDIDARKQAIVKAIEELNQSDIKILYVRQLRKSELK
jgi:hypothetical protein